jgi:hypothetical protein
VSADCVREESNHSPVELPGRIHVETTTRRSSWPGPRWFLPSLITATALLRFPALLWPLTPDEAGFLLVARNVVPAPGSLYGTYWVDRPPTLIAYYWLTDALAGPYGPRFVAVLASSMLIVGVYRAAYIAAGIRAARCGAVAAAAWLVNPQLNAWTGKGEVIGVTLVALSCWASIATVSSSARPRLMTAFVAGLTAGLAVGFKQNLLGGVVFGVALIGFSALRRQTSVPDAVRAASVATVGVILSWAPVALWVLYTPTDWHAFFYQVVGFRADASTVLVSVHSTALENRLSGLWEVFWAIGMGWALTASLLTQQLRWRSLGVIYPALACMLACDIAGVMAGGSYWRAYLIPLIVPISLLLALMSKAEGWRRTLATVLVLGVVSVTGKDLYDHSKSRLSGSDSPVEYNAGRAIRAVARPHDTIVSLYGHPEVVEASHLRSPYPFLWSLPMRTIDPRLQELSALLEGSDAPTWVLVVLPLDSWGLDSARVGLALQTRYVLVSERCGMKTYRRADQPRKDPHPVACHEPWSAIAED